MKNLLIAVVLLPLLSCGKTTENAAPVATETETTSAVDSTVITPVDTATVVIVDKAIETTIDKKIEITNDKNTSRTVQKVTIKTTTPVATVKTEVTPKAEAVAINHSNWNTLLQKNVLKSGLVNYKGFKQDSNALSAYLKELSANVPNKSWSRNATLAYWINAYNAYTVKLIVYNYPTKSIKNLNDPWGKKFITLAGKNYSLEGIENEILRKMNEPRIHFAINCASISCPELLNEAYTEGKLEQQLKTVTRNFINDKTKNTITASKIKVSKIFDWFAVDFKSKGGVIDYLNDYSTTKISSNAQVNFKEYDWNLNE
jgi:hypothetical protein